MSDRAVNMRDDRIVLYEQLEIQKQLGYERYSEHSRESFVMAVEAANEPRSISMRNGSES